MRADAPENQAEIVFRVILDGQPPQEHEAAPVLDLPADFLDDWAQRWHLEMLALQPVEADPSRFDPPHGSSDVAQLSRIEVDRVIRRRAEIGDRPGARMPDRRGKDRGRRRVVVLRCARLKDCRHCSASSCFTESVRPKPLPFNPAQPLERAPQRNRPRELFAQVVRERCWQQYPCGSLSDRCRLVGRPSPRHTEMSEKRRFPTFLPSPPERGVSTGAAAPDFWTAG